MGGHNGAHGVTRPTCFSSPRPPSLTHYADAQSPLTHGKILGDWSKAPVQKLQLTRYYENEELHPAQFPPTQSGFDGGRPAGIEPHAARVVRPRSDRRAGQTLANLATCGREGGYRVLP